jgi:hypothetical protein
MREQQLLLQRRVEVQGQGAGQEEELRGQHELMGALLNLQDQGPLDCIVFDECHLIQRKKRFMAWSF